MANDSFNDLFNSMSEGRKLPKVPKTTEKKSPNALPKIPNKPAEVSKKAAPSQSRNALPKINNNDKNKQTVRRVTRTVTSNKGTVANGSKPSSPVHKVVSKPKVSEHPNEAPTSKPVHKDPKNNPYAKYISKPNTGNHNEVRKPQSSSVYKVVKTSKPSVPVHKQSKDDTHIPLSRPGMSDVKVTKDGKTLEDMLPHLRGGANPIDKTIADIRNKASDVSINNKKVSDNRYTKHKDIIDNDVKRTDARRKLSTKFVQRNARYTEDEKIILRNLGIPMNDLVNTLKKDDLTKGDKMNILKYGSKGLERYYKGKRFRVTHANLETLTFLAKFKFASTRILSLLQGEPQATTNRRLHRMKKSGLVADYEVPGMGTIWCTTEIGMALTGYDLKTFRQKRPKMSTMPPIIGINYVAACLWHNKYDVLFLPDYPANNFTRNGSDGKQWKLPGEDLVSEQEIRSSYGKELKPKGSDFGDATSITQDQLIQNAHLIWHKWEREGRNPDSPEFYPGNEYLWIVFPENGLSVNYHVPDLVIARPRKSDGTPQSIAVECELSHKSAKNYEHTMQAYKDDKHIYDRVIWITNNASITRAIQQAAEKVGNTNYDIVPFTNENGVYKNRDIWYI